MRRAAVAAAFGSLVIPVVPTLYSVYLLGRHGGAMMSARGKRNRAIAIVFNTLALAIAGFFASLRCQCGCAAVSATPHRRSGSETMAGIMALSVALVGVFRSRVFPWRG